jgi:hypothetical protein
MRVARQSRFIADAMLGRLARWLRLLGYDVAYQRDISDEKLALRSWREKRVILTRDNGFRARTVNAIFIKSDQIWEQLHQVIRDCRLRPSAPRFYTRCSLCNGVLKKALKASVRGLVPAYVYQEQKRFARCPRCKKVYWMGSHAALFDRRLLRLKNSALSLPPLLGYRPQASIACGTF